MFTAGFIMLPSMFTTSVRICVWICNVQEVSSGNQSSLNAASRDTLHLTKIIIRRPLILCNFLRGLSLWRRTISVQGPLSTIPPSQRVILSLEDKTCTPMVPETWKRYLPLIQISYPTYRIFPLLCHYRNANVLWQIQMNSPSFTERDVYSNEVLTTPWVILTVGLPAQQTFIIIPL